MRGYDSAELILTCLEGHPGGLSKKMLLSKTGLTEGQYRTGHNWTLDTFDEEIWIKNYVGGEWIYLMPESYMSCKEDVFRDVRTAITRERRHHNKVRAIAKKHPTVEMRDAELEAEYRLRKLQIEKDRLGK